MSAYESRLTWSKRWGFLALLLGAGVCLYAKDGVSFAAIVASLVVLFSTAKVQDRKIHQDSK